MCVCNTLYCAEGNAFVLDQMLVFESPHSTTITRCKHYTDDMLCEDIVITHGEDITPCIPCEYLALLQSWKKQRWGDGKLETVYDNDNDHDVERAGSLADSNVAVYESSGAATSVDKSTSSINKDSSLSSQTSLTSSHDTNHTGIRAPPPSCIQDWATTKGSDDDHHDDHHDDDHDHDSDDVNDGKILPICNDTIVPMPATKSNPVRSPSTKPVHDNPLNGVAFWQQEELQHRIQEGPHHHQHSESSSPLPSPEVQIPKRKPLPLPTPTQPQQEHKSVFIEHLDHSEQGFEPPPAAAAAAAASSQATAAAVEAYHRDPDTLMVLDPTPWLGPAPLPGKPPSRLLRWIIKYKQWKWNLKFRHRRGIFF